jgi:hypothetical protein
LNIINIFIQLLKNIFYVQLINIYFFNFFKS